MSVLDIDALGAAIRSFRANPKVLCVRAGVQHYAWGARDFIPELLGIRNPQDKPFAELWMGAHPELPADAQLSGHGVPLDDLIDVAAEEVLGPGVASRFSGKLPYLFKVLSAAVPLSIQAHPTKQQAEVGFARENADAIPLTAGHRNYKDANHKPEILAALTDFYALSGFRPLEEIGRVLGEVPELRRVMPAYQPTPESLQGLYEKLMTLSQEAVNAMLNPLMSRLTAADRQRPFGPNDREYWILRADREFSRDDCRDRGLFSIYLLNLIHLQPGDAVYLPAGVLHAYLQGSGMELMANSNNVLRGGLTRKHVDVPELLARVSFQGGPPDVIRPRKLGGGFEHAYETPASEFELRRIDVSPERPFQSGAEHSADIVIVTSVDESAKITLDAAGEQQRLRQGDVFLAPCGIDFSIHASAPVTLFRATIPAASVAGPPRESPLL